MKSELLVDVRHSLLAVSEGGVWVFWKVDMSRTADGYQALEK